MTNTILQSQTRVRREIARRFQSDLFNACQLREHVMRETHGHVKATEGSGAFGTPRMPTRPMTWSMTAKAKPHKPSEFESVLLAIAGHDLRQPLQVIQNVHDILDRGLRTASELRLLRYGQSAVERFGRTLAEPYCCCCGALASIDIRTIDLVRRIVVEAPRLVGSSGSLIS
jgi:hypothetical protein